MTLPRISRALAAPLILAFLLFFAPGSARGDDYRIAPAPTWVQPLAPRPGASHPEDQISGGIDYLLVDSQTRVEGERAERFFHSVTRVVNRQGIESAAQVAIDFDPSFQTLILHQVRVLRGAVAVDQLTPERISVLQRERELEYLIFDGTRTLNLILDDVRVGDLVEYSYTLEGLNPVFSGRFFDGVELQWAVPVDRLSWRLLWPAGRPLHWKNHGTPLEPAVTRDGDWQVYLWQQDDIPPLIEDDLLPEWYQPYPWVQLGEMESWSEVVDWALPLYRVPHPLSVTLQKRIAEIASAAASPEERVRAVLRFVQDEVRYLGIEVGPGSHAPSDPSLVMQRRFGDCKDKALLAATMLGELGIEAAPALVDTRLGRRIADYLPAPTVFNHVILHVRLEGRNHWLDPTRNEQRGTLGTLTPPDFGLALVLEPGSRDLKAMAPSDPAQVTRAVSETFDLRPGIGAPAQLQVVTVYSGPAADGMRARLATSSRGELEKVYLNFYSATYPAITAAAPLETADDEQANRLTVTERYTVPGLWERNEEEGRWEAIFYPVEMADFFEAPPGLRRQMPLAIPFPANCRLTTEVLLPEGWSIKGEVTEIDDPLFSYARTVGYAKDRLTLSYRFQTRGDHLDPEALASYAKNLRRARESLGYRVYSIDAASASVFGGGMWASLLAPVLIVVVLRLRRRTTGREIGR